MATASDDPDKWFTYLLAPATLSADIEAGVAFASLQPLLHDFLSNLLNNQTAGFFNENPQELWFARSEERKCSVLRSLCLRLGAYSGWRLTELERFLPPPLLLFLLTSLVQVQPGQEEEEASLANTNRHLELDIASMTSPGPALQSLTLLHRWVVRTFMMIKTPVRMERTSNMMVPGVKRAPAVIYRDQTYTLVSAVAPTSIKFLTAVLDQAAAPASVPSHKSFRAESGSGAAAGWDEATLQPCDRALFLALTAYDLGRCYLFCEDYVKARQCFSKYFENTTAALAPSSAAVLRSEIDEASLAGHLLCLDMDTAAYQVKEPSFLLGQIVDSTRQQNGTVEILKKDDVDDNMVMFARETLEDECSSEASTHQKALLPNVQIHNIIKRTLLGLPLTTKQLRLLSRLPDTSQLEAALGGLKDTASSRHKLLLRMLVVELVIAGVISQRSKLLESFGIGKVNMMKGTSNIKRPATTKVDVPTFKIESFGYEKIEKLNNYLQLLSTFSPSQVPHLVANIGGKNVRRLSTRWSLEAEQLSRQKSMSDQMYAMLVKVAQLKKLKRFSEAGALLDKVAMLGSVEAEQLLLGLEVAEDQRQAPGPELAAVRDTDTLARLCHPALTVASLTALCNAGDWEAVTRLLAHHNLPHLTSLPGSQATLVAVVRLVAGLMTSRHNNQTLAKKHGRELWELLCTVAQSGAAPGSKRSAKELNTDNSATRAVVTAWMRRLTHSDLTRLVTSLLASLFNVVRDDPNTDILSPDGALWPTHVVQPLQERTVEDMLTQVLTSALGHHPHDPTLVRMMADLQFANSHYASALALYVETAAVKTDFYLAELGPGLAPSCIEDGVVSRMVTCTRELGRLTQAVVLSQFTQEPNYAQTFKFLEDRTVDGSDCLYGCIWDMAILEFAMSLHTKRGEAARRRAALQCIWQLELNTNNDEEIIKEAANVRKAMFFRSLAQQMF